MVVWVAGYCPPGLRRAGLQGRLGWSGSLRWVVGWVALGVGLDLPRHPVDHKGARPGGSCQLPILIVWKDIHGCWRSGVDRTLPAWLAAPRLGDEGGPILRPEVRLTAALCASPLPVPDRTVLVGKTDEPGWRWRCKYLPQL